MSIGLFLTAALCLICLMLMSILKKENSKEKAALISISVMCVLFGAVLKLSSGSGEEASAPEYYKDGNEIYTVPPATKTIFSPPAHNNELGDAIYSVVADLGIKREEVSVRPTLNIDVKVEDINHGLLTVTFNLESDEAMKQTKGNIIEISQRIIDKYEPLGITYRFKTVKSDDIRSSMMLTWHNEPGEELFWSLGYMKDGIYKTEKLYKNAVTE